MHVIIVVCFYALAIAVGIWLALDTGLPDRYFDRLKELKELLVAFPAAWLAFCVQRRLAYTKDAKDLWIMMVEAIQASIQYTHLSEPTQKEYGKVLRSISVVMDNVRATFVNCGESAGNVGLYPFERLKEIHRIISDLDFEDGFRAHEARAARHEIVEEWKMLRRQYLLQLERGLPTTIRNRLIEE